MSIKSINSVQYSYLAQNRAGVKNAIPFKGEQDSSTQEQQAPKNNDGLIIGGTIAAVGITLGIIFRKSISKWFGEGTKAVEKEAENLAAKSKDAEKEVKKPEDSVNDFVSNDINVDSGVDTPIVNDIPAPEASISHAEEGEKPVQPLVSEPSLTDAKIINPAIKADIPAPEALKEESDFRIVADNKNNFFGPEASGFRAEEDGKSDVAGSEFTSFQDLLSRELKDDALNPGKIELPTGNKVEQPTPPIAPKAEESEQPTPMHSRRRHQGRRSHRHVPPIVEKKLEQPPVQITKEIEQPITPPPASAQIQVKEEQLLSTDNLPDLNAGSKDEFADFQKSVGEKLDGNVLKESTGEIGESVAENTEHPAPSLEPAAENAEHPASLSVQEGDANLSPEGLPEINGSKEEFTDFRETEQLVDEIDRPITAYDKGTNQLVLKEVTRYPNGVVKTILKKDTHTEKKISFQTFSKDGTPTSVAQYNSEGRVTKKIDFYTKTNKSNGKGDLQAKISGDNIEAEDYKKVKEYNPETEEVEFE